MNIDDIEEYSEEYRDRLEDEGELVTSDPDRHDDGELKIVPLGLGEAAEVHTEMQRSNNRSRNTIKSHRSRLKKFIAWLNINGVDDTTDIRPHHFHDYLKQRQKNVKAVTAKTHMDSIRVWIRNLEDYGAIRPNLHDHVRSPSLAGEQGQRSDHLPILRGDPILQHVRKYEWGSLRHVVYELWWAAGIRLGGVHSLDVKDFDADDQCVELRHRPESGTSLLDDEEDDEDDEDDGTTLKNKEDGERDVGLTDRTVEAIEAYLENPERPDVTDDHGRHPLFTTEHGRASKSHLRNVCYHLTLPCITTGECPHDNDPNDCLYRSNKNESSKCESSKAPHALRSGALTRQLKRGIDPHYISERANVGLETLENHYNEMSEREKMQVRREHFDREYSGMNKQEQEDRLFDRSD